MAEVSRFVVDASIATQWHLRDPLEHHVERAAAVRRDLEAGRIVLFAPDQIRYEVGAAILNATRTRPPRLTTAEGSLTISDVGLWGVTFVADNDLLPAAYLMGRRWGCSFYDGLYVALAQRLGIPLLHADNNLRNALGNSFPLALWIEEYKPS